MQWGGGDISGREITPILSAVWGQNFNKELSRSPCGSVKAEAENVRGAVGGGWGRNKQESGEETLK